MCKSGGWITRSDSLFHDKINLAWVSAQITRWASEKPCQLNWRHRENRELQFNDRASALDAKDSKCNPHLLKGTANGWCEILETLLCLAEQWSDQFKAFSSAHMCSTCHPHGRQPIKFSDWKEYRIRNKVWHSLDEFSSLLGRYSPFGIPIIVINGLCARPSYKHR